MYGQFISSYGRYSNVFKVRMQSFNSPTLQWLFLLPFHRNKFLASIQTSCSAFPKWMSRPCQHLGLHPVPNHLGCPATLLRPPLWCPQPGCDSLLAILCRSTFSERDTTFELFNVSIKNSWRHKQRRGEANSKLVRREEKYQINKDKAKDKAKGCYQRNKEYLSDKKTGKGGMSNLQVFCIQTICPHTFSLKAPFSQWRATTNDIDKLWDLIIEKLWLFHQIHFLMRHSSIAGMVCFFMFWQIKFATDQPFTVWTLISLMEFIWTQIRVESKRFLRSPLFIPSTVLLLEVFGSCYASLISLDNLSSKLS